MTAPDEPMSGVLYLVPTPIAEGPLEAALPTTVMATVRRIDHFLAENAKSARTFLREVGHPRPLRELSIVEIGHEPRVEHIDTWLAPLAQGHDIALVSEAGCPAVADPGATLVAAAHAQGWQVRPLVGPSAILLALMASGLDGQRFRFHGYLPIGREERRECLQRLERESRGGETQIFIETPYRGQALFDAMLESCAAATRVAVAVDLGGAEEWVRMQSIEAWRRTPAASRPLLQKRPAVFCLLA
jgi:16S rRNA (cytidine1402-2'-O)-methyltransferase